MLAVPGRIHVATPPETSLVQEDGQHRKPKRKLYNSFYKRMRGRIDKTCERSNTFDQSIPTNDGISWTKERLLQQADIKKKDHLNAKDCGYFSCGKTFTTVTFFSHR